MFTKINIKFVNIKQKFINNKKIFIKINIYDIIKIGCDLDGNILFTIRVRIKKT